MKTAPYLQYLLLPLCVLALSTPLNTKALSIMLTNDDGIDSIGLTSLEAALINAGHTVTVIAPAEEQSGMGTSLTVRQALKVNKRDARHYVIHGKPADTAMIGLTEILKTTPPDLVISGANFGQNIGPIANSSGTVSAAITASSLGVPAIALSVGIDFSEAKTQPRFKSTLSMFKPAAQFLVSLIKQLEKNSAMLLPAHTVLNINYPISTATPPVKITAISNTSPFNLSYIYDEAQQQYQLQFLPGDTTQLNGDSKYFSEGFITISILKNNWDATTSEHNKALNKQLRKAFQ
jgi:5'/3'-nucleotidase SurE